MDHLRRLFSYVRPYRGRLAVGIVAVTVASLVALLFPLLIRNLLNTASRRTPTPWTRGRCSTAPRS